jgi:quercetin dioxygenase-like cupin family protein
VTVDRTDDGPRREVLVEVAGLRVQLVSLEAHQQVPWHEHSMVSDTIVAVAGKVVVDIGAPATRWHLEPGQRLAIPAGTAHSVSGDGGPCRFLNIHAGGAYDFLPRAGAD